LEVFWRSHNPARRSWSRQYKIAVFYHNREQKKLAVESKESIAAKTDGKVRTEIIPYSEFYLAEPYHQKYQLQRNRNFMREFEAIYSANEDFVNSTSAARVNGYLGGHGSLSQLQAELIGLGLSAAGAENLLHIVHNSR
jgi:peptide-methionine (S)-S-oxide reductase